MCNLYRHSMSPAEIAQLFGTSPIEFSEKARTSNIEPAYVGADQDGPVIVKANNNKLEYDYKRWGFPEVIKGAKPITNIRNLNSSWWKGANGEYILKPQYRCLVPFSRFAEWSVKDKANAWFEVGVDVSFFAGVWRPWTGERLAYIEGHKRRQRQVRDWSLFAFLTTEANKVVAEVHPKAMPVILTTQDECLEWLGGGESSLALQRPLPENKIKRVQ